MDGNLPTTRYRSFDADPLEKLFGAIMYIFGRRFENGVKIAGCAAENTER